MAEAYGLTPDPWQFRVIKAWLSERSDGKWAAARCGLAVPRQNGKNGVIEVVELYKMVALGRRILHTAHEVKTARKAFIRLCSFFENDREFPDLARMVKEIRRTNGQEAIILTNGGGVEFIARSKGSGRGFTVDDLVCDEAQDLNDDALAALLPTISAAPSKNPQVVFTGTPPVNDTDGQVWTRFRDAGVGGEDPRLAWAEWSVSDDVRELRSLDEALEIAWETNPALGIRLSIETVADEFAAMALDVFLRERHGQWRSAGAGSRLISAELWEKQGRSKVQVEAIKADEQVRTFGVTFSLDGKRVAVAGGLKHADGAHAEVVDGFSGHMEAGVDALAAWLAEESRRDKTALYAISGRSHAEVLSRKLIELGVPRKAVHILNSPEYFTACSMYETGMRDGSVTHSADEAANQTILDRSVAVCDKKLRGTAGSWSWEVTVPGGDETPLEAVSVAVWAALTTKRRPGRKVKAVVLG